MTDVHSGPHLIPGPAHFVVTEDPAYEPNGKGEHLYVRLRKISFTTDAVSDALAKVYGVKNHSVGYAGRKDRHAITSQWFSIHTPRDVDHQALLDRLQAEPDTMVLECASRHANKLRLGHLTGNRFVLGIADISVEDLTTQAQALYAGGLINRFGSQRFGRGGQTLTLATIWATGSALDIVSHIIHPNGKWQIGDELPGFRSGPEGRVIGALRRGVTPEKALAAGGETLRQLVASAAQSAVFNAIIDARIDESRLYTPRCGEIAAIPSGAVFVVTAEDEASVQERAKPGVFDTFTTAPLPGFSCKHGDERSLAEEKAWSAPTNVDWAWFNKDQPLASPGERRAAVVPLRSEPVVREADGHVILELSLPPGSYASEALEHMGIAMPADRRG